MTHLTIGELVNEVERSFNEIKVERPNHVFLTLQSRMIKLMKDKGWSNYEVSHIKKDRLEQAGDLPINVCYEVVALLYADTKMPILSTTYFCKVRIALIII